MRKLIVSEFVTLDGVMQAPGGKDEDRDGGFEHGGWTIPYWHDDIGATFGALMQGVDAFLLGRRTYVIHGQAFEPMPAGDPFGDMMNAPKKYVVSRTLETPIWRDKKACIGHLSKSSTGTLGDPRISEAGRAFLADLLMQLSDDQIRALFEVSRVTLRLRDPAKARSGFATVEEWTDVFKRKRAEIVERRCA